MTLMIQIVHYFCNLPLAATDINETTHVTPFVCKDYSATRDYLTYFNAVF